MRKILFKTCATSFLLSYAFNCDLQWLEVGLNKDFVRIRKNVTFRIQSDRILKLSCYPWWRISIRKSVMLKKTASDQSFVIVSIKINRSMINIVQTWRFEILHFILVLAVNSIQSNSSFRWNFSNWLSDL